ncbi:thymopoietin a isoform X4 [Platichthys flesus]|uniref:thymopoietin a isoform X4 n=1 Tax=Platichthys flesus TaxID=8260 RepID=UPI002DBF938D|nr:thymopoietin a isoform X4 [Platichthys flesus]
MPVYLEDPSVLTKDKLKSELMANSVELPSGNPTKDVYVQLYLRNLTAQNEKHVVDTTWDAFSSDEELPPPVVYSRSRSSGRKATRKTDKVQPDELDVTVLTDDGLRDSLIEQGVVVGPIVASTRKLYEKKLQKLLDNGPAQPPLPELVLAEIQVNHNGHSEADLYSDKEDEGTAEPEPEPQPEPEPVAEPEPAPPVVERPVRSRGKLPITTRTRSSQHQTIVPEDIRPVLREPVYLEYNRKVHDNPESPAQAETPSASSIRVKKEYGPPDIQLHKRRQQKISSFPSTCSPVEKITASDQNPKVEEKVVLKELFPSDFNSPTGINATCRRPIRGAAGRPVKPSDLWNDENGLYSPKITKTTSSSSYTESRTVNRVTSLPPSTTSPSSARLLSAAPPAGQTKAVRSGMSLWIKLFLLAVVAAFLFLVYQAMETNRIAPFLASDKEVASGGIE